MIDHYIGVDVGTGSVRAGLVSQVSRQYILFLVSSYSYSSYPLCASLSCLQYGISFGNKMPDNVDWDYIVLLSNLIEEGTVQCIVE